MQLLQRVKKANLIIKREGFVRLIKTLKDTFVTRYYPHGPDESKMAFEALDANRVKGVMVDVGANVGNSLTAFARSGWRVFAFEPDSENRRALIGTFGKLQNVTIDTRAISDRRLNEVTLYRSEESTGISGLSNFHPSHKACENVDVTTLEFFFDEQGITTLCVDFLKIDTEGYDLCVLKGFPWNRTSPRLILCEFEDAKTIPLGYTFRDLARFLQDKGYKLIVSEWYPIKKYGGPHDWRRLTPYPCELEDPKAWGNIFATKDPGLYDSLLSMGKRP